MKDFPTAPDALCILRLSALGDVTHVLPVVHSLQAAWPDVRLSWVIGKLEHKLVGALPGVEFLPYDKRGGWAARRDLRRRLAGRQFDALLLMQLSLRANLLSTAIPARRRIGYDRARSKEGHGMFVNRRIQTPAGGHVLDTLLAFVAALGVEPRYDWTLPIAEADLAWAKGILADAQPYAIISPCSSHALRNWHVSGYARAVEHLVEVHGLKVLLCGGPSDQEKTVAAAIERESRAPCRNLVGRDTLTQYLALLKGARLLLTPDAGPAHMAAITRTPVVGLYAATDPQRSGPYLSREYCVDAYDRAARHFLGRPAVELRWGTKIERPGVMDLISVADVCDKVDLALAAQSENQ